MGDTSERMDIETLFSLANDLTNLLNDGKDGDNLMQCLENAKSLRSFCEINAHENNVSLEECQKRINGFKEKIENVEGEGLTDSEIVDLQTQLEKKMQMEYLLREGLREVSDLLGDLEQQRVSLEKRWQLANHREKDLQKSQDSLSMCASITGIIPDSTDKKKISGFSVERGKKKVERFKIDPGMPPFQVCDALWKMADP
ncbi:hypothetical protein KSP39_PZI008037 [Platanthera zijinensis]|uniref:Kinetochore protein Spc24 n=1 Tax=Platanthera zijinensis TaxID=2320716 RepID=A0AAP0BMT5_9ASPA